MACDFYIRYVRKDIFYIYNVVKLIKSAKSMMSVKFMFYCTGIILYFIFIF